MWSEENAVSGLVEDSREVWWLGEQSTWMDWMSLGIWNSPSTVPMTATCRWTSVRGSRYELGDQCRMWFVGCAPTVQRGESRSGGIVLVVVVDLEVDVVLHDVMGKRSEE